jgi:hypothetical protein
VIVYLTKPSQNIPSKLVFVGLQKEKCFELTSSTLPYIQASQTQGVDPSDLENVLNDPIILGIHKYLLFFPNPSKTSEYYLYGVEQLMQSPYFLETHSEQRLKLLEHDMALKDSVQVARHNQDAFNIFLPLNH